MNQNNLCCFSLNCDIENLPEDTQSHTLLCQSLRKRQDKVIVKMEFMNGSVEEQSQLAKQFSVLYKRRLKKLEEQEEVSSSSLPGALFLDLSTRPLQQQRQGAAAVHSVQLLG